MPLQRYRHHRINLGIPTRLHASTLASDLLRCLLDASGPGVSSSRVRMGTCLGRRVSVDHQPKRGIRPSAMREITSVQIHCDKSTSQAKPRTSKISAKEGPISKRATSSNSAPYSIAPPKAARYIRDLHPIQSVEPGFPTPPQSIPESNPVHKASTLQVSVFLRIHGHYTCTDDMGRTSTINMTMRAMVVVALMASGVAAKDRSVDNPYCGMDQNVSFFCGVWGRDGVVGWRLGDRRAKRFYLRLPWLELVSSLLGLAWLLASWFMLWHACMPLHVSLEA